MCEKTPTLKLCKIPRYIHRYLNWLLYINHLSLKLGKANAMPCKLRPHINEATTKSFYYAIFHPHLWR